MELLLKIVLQILVPQKRIKKSQLLINPIQKLNFLYVVVSNEYTFILIFFSAPI